MQADKERDNATNTTDGEGGNGDGGNGDDPWHIAGTQYENRDIWEAPDEFGNINYKSGAHGHSLDDFGNMVRQWAAEAGWDISDADVEDYKRQANADWSGNSEFIDAQGGNAQGVFAKYRDHIMRRGPGGGGGGGGGTAVERAAGMYRGPSMDQFSAYLQQNQARIDAERAQTRQLLMEQLGAASRPVSATDPGIAPILDAQRLALQRSSERQRSQMAARLANENLLDSGTFDTGMLGIEQARGEAMAGFTGDILNRELNARREQLTQLLAMAVQSGDAESARQIQTQLAAITAQMDDRYRYAALAEGARQFDMSDLFRYDQLGANYSLGLAGLNLDALRLLTPDY